MKKIIILAIAMLLCSTLLPGAFLAENGNKNVDLSTNPSEEVTEIEESVDNKEEPASTEESGKEYNEFGVEIGTMVFDQDISKLSEEELQYIPEGWRDGVGLDEHHHSPGSEEHGDHEGHDHHDEEEEKMTAMQVYPNVNNRILSNNLSIPKVEYNHLSILTKFNYRYGRPEGVVAHETANNTSTINGEISWMTQNHRNAFVHAYVDHNRIIEVHDPNLGAWGGGFVANQRYIHVELVRVHTYDNFVRSMNNYSDYIASLLYRYNLGVTNADINGRGSLWSHRAVSNFLGGTNHVDPHGYFARWGYNWNDFISLVTHKYNNMASAQQSDVNKMGHINSSGVQLYPDLNNLNASSSAGSTHTHAVYYIKKEAVKNGQLYYLLSRNDSSTTGVIGWAKASDINAQNRLVVDKNSKTFYLTGNGSSFSKPWGGSKDLIQPLGNLKDREFKVNLTESVGTQTWYRGEVAGQTVWIRSNLVTASIESTTSKLGHLRSSAVQIYPDLANASSAISAGSTYTQAVYYIKKEGVRNGELYYLLSQNPSSVTGVIGWARAADVNAQDHRGIDRNAKTFYLTGSGAAYTKAWGGSKDFVYPNLGTYTNQKFNVHLTESVGSATWYRGDLAGETVWVRSNQVATAPSIEIKEETIHKLGHIRSSDVELYPNLLNTSSFVKAGNEYTHTVYYVKKEAEKNGQLYYQLSRSASGSAETVAWAKAEDINTRDHLAIDEKAKTFYLKGATSAYDMPWGGSKNIVLQTSAGQEFKVERTESAGGSIWHYGELSGNKVWILENQLTIEIEVRTSKLGHIRSSNVKIYPDFKDQTSSFTAGSTYTHAVYYIKKESFSNGQKYYLLSLSPSSVNGLIGWAKAEDISANTHVVADRNAKSFKVKGTGSAYSKAWGGRNDFVYPDLTVYRNQEFKVHLTETVGSATWYRGTLGGRTVWIHPSHLE